MADVFAELKKEKGELWNRASKEAENAIAGKGPARNGQFIYVASDLKEIYKKYTTERELLAQKDAFETLLGDIKRNLSLGKTPKREDFVQAAKRAEDIIQVLGESTGETTLDPELLSILNTSAKEVLEVLGANTPGKIKAGTSAIGAKMKSTAGGFLKGMVSEMTAGIPFAPELMELAGSKIKGAFGGVTEEQKEMASMLGGVGTAGGAGGDAEANGGVSTGPTAGMKGLGNIKDMTGKAQSFFGKALGREEEIGKEEGGIVAGGEGLEETNDILRDILIAVSPDREALEEAKRKKEMLRQEGKGGKVKFGDKGWMKAMMGGLMGGAIVIGAIAAAIGALVMMVFDGIEGYFLAEKWGVSKTTAIIAAVIGGTGHGFTGAMWGGAKGGLAGFAIGLGIGGPLGALIGGLVGVALGAIAGYFGGERIAKLLKEMEEWFQGAWESLRVGLGLTKYSKTELADINAGKQGGGLQQAAASRQSVAKSAGGGVIGEMVGGTTYAADLAAQYIADADFTGPLLHELMPSVVGEKGIFGQFLLNMFSASQSQWWGGGSNQEPTSSNQKPTIRPPIVLEQKPAPPLVQARGGIVTKPLYLPSTDTPSRPQARGGIVTKPLYLPSSGIVVGEHPTYSGKGAYAGGLTPLSQMGMGEVVPDRKNESGMEAIIPLDQRGIDVMKKAVGRDLNDAQMEKMMGRGARPEQPTTIIDASTIQNVSNNTVIRSPSPSGPGLHFERRDFVHKIA